MEPGPNPEPVPEPIPPRCGERNLALQFNGAEGDGAELEDDTILGATFTSCTGTKVQILTLRYSVRSLLALPQEILGTQFTCFTGTKVQILTQKALVESNFIIRGYKAVTVEMWVKDNSLPLHRTVYFGGGEFQDEGVEEEMSCVSSS